MFQDRPGSFREVVQDFDSLLGVSADREVIDKQQLYPGIILDPFTILIEILLAVQNDQFIQQITVIHELTAIIPATSSTQHAERK